MPHSKTGQINISIFHTASARVVWGGFLWMTAAPEIGIKTLI